MPNPWDAFPRVKPVAPQSENPWDAFERVENSEPETRDLNDWEVQESQQRQEELRGRFSSTAGTVVEDAAAFNQYAPPEQAPVDEAKLFAREQTLRGMPSNAGKDVGALARQQLQPEYIENQERELAISEAIKDFEAGRGREFNVGTGEYKGIPTSQSKTYEAIINHQNDVRRVRDLTFRQENIEAETARQTTEDIGIIPTRLATAGMDLATGLPGFALRGVDAVTGTNYGAGLDEIGRQSNKFGAAASDLEKKQGTSGYIKGRIGGALGSLAQMIAMPGPGKYGQEAVQGVNTGLNAYNDARANGMGVFDSLTHGVTQGVAEGGIAAGFKKIGLGGTEDLFRGAVSGGVKEFTKQMAGELTEENITTIAQMALPTILQKLNDDKRWEQLGATTDPRKYAQAIMDTTVETLMVGATSQGIQQRAEVGAEAKALVDAISKKGSQAIRDALDYGPVRGLETLAGIDGRFSKKQREDALKELERISQEQPELNSSQGEQRIGQQFAEPLAPESAQGQPEAQTDAEIAEDDLEARKQTPQYRTPPNDPFGMPNISDSQAMQEAARRILRERKQFSEAGIERQIKLAMETGVPPALAAKELEAQFSQDAAIQNDNPESSGFLPEQARADYDQQAFPQRAAEAIGEADAQLKINQEQDLAARGIEKVAPDEAAQALQGEQIERVLEEVGVGRDQAPDDISKTIEELDAKPDDNGYVRDQQKIKPQKGKKYGALLDDFETEQQDRIKQRVAGDRRVTIVNPHPVTGLIEGKYANQRLAEMSVERAIATGKPVTYVEGDFHNLGGLNTKFGQTRADKHLRNITSLFKKFIPQSTDIALVHKGGDEYGFHFVGMDAKQAREALDKSKPYIEAYSKKHGLGLVPHTKEGKSGGVGINYSIEQFDPKKHKAGNYKDAQGGDLRLNQAGALIYHADRALETEKKKHGTVKKSTPEPDGGRSEGPRVAEQPSAVQPAQGGKVGVPQGATDARPQPEGSGKAVERKARVKSFKTSQGSHYAVTGGTTQRTKTPHMLHDSKDVGLKKPSEKTVYVKDRDAMTAMGMLQSLSSKYKGIMIRDGKIYALDSDGGKWKVDSFANGIEFSDEPSIGSRPLELWQSKQADNGAVMYSNWHPGNEITEVEYDSDETQPTVKNRAVTAEQVQQIIPGSTIKDSKDGYTVTLSDGQKIPVVFSDKVKLNKKQAKAEYEVSHNGGKKLTKEQWNVVLNSGKIEAIAGYDPNTGKIILGPKATAKDMAEEVVHAFIDKGIITKDEYRVLAGDFSKMGKAPNLVEEDIAKAYQKWTGETETAGGKIFQRVFGGEQGPPKPPDSPKTPDSPSGESGKSGEPYGRPNLANNGKTKAERDFVDDVDQVRKERGDPAKKKDSDARESAKERFDADPEAAEKHVFSEEFDGSKAEDFHLGVLVQSRIFNRAMKSNSEAEWTKAADAQNLIRSGGTEASANLRARADITMTPRQRLETMLITPDREHARMIRNARTPAERRAALEKWAKRVVEIKNSLKIDLDGYEQMDEAGQAAVEDALGLAKNSTWVGMLKEIWRNFGLSAIKTHTKNSAGNAIHGSKGIFLDRLAESAMTHLQELGRKGRKIDAASLGEFKYVFRGMSPGLWNGLAKAGSTLKFGSRDNKLTEGYGPQIPGKIGHVIRFVDRLSGAADDLAHTMFAHMEVGAQAYRIARSEGLKGQELQERVTELMKPPEKGKEPSEAWVRALAAADRYTFKGDNSLAQGITKLRDEPIQIAGFTAPEFTTLPAYMMFTFVKTPVNIAFEGLKQFTPAGSLDAAIKMHRNYKDGKDIVSGEASRAIAQQIIMVGMIAAMYALKSSRDDEEQTGIGFTGANDFGNTAKGATGRRTSQANSIHIGPWAISHSWAEPITTGLSLASDVIDAKKRGKSMVGAGVANLFNATTEKTFLKTFGDIVKIGQAVGSGDESRRDEAIRRFAQNMITGWVPNINKNTSRNSREDMDETRVWGEGEERTKMAWKRLYQASELPGAPAYFPKRDLFGQTIERPQPFGTPYTDAAFRLLSPADIKKIENHVGDRLIVNWNNQQGVKEWYPNEPRPDYKKDGKTHYIPEDLYDRYLKESGEAVLAAVKNAAPSHNNFAKPTAQNIKWLKRTIKIQRDAWRRKNLGMTEAVQDDEEQEKD